jgi:hypothetical protein
MERTMGGMLDRSLGAANARRIVATVLIAIGLAAIVVHGKATRSLKLAAAEKTETIGVVERPTSH